MESPAPSSLRFGDFLLDPKAGELRKAGHRIKLQPQPFKVLSILASRPGEAVTRDAAAPHDSVISVHVGSGVDEAYAEAKRRGYEIVHPLTDEAWGVRRFFVRAPDGNVISMVNRRD